MQKPDAGRKKLLRKGSFLPALFLFQTYPGYIASIDKTIEAMQAFFRFYTNFLQ